MTTPYWKTKTKSLMLAPKPFRTETEFEQYIYDNQELLGGDIYIIHRQVRTGSKHGVADMVGVDQDSKICIVEVKNVDADENILTQSLGYAFWAESNPDALQKIWLLSKDKPDGLEIDWGNSEVRIILIAPSFKANVQSLASKFAYQVDLFRVQRYSGGTADLVLVDQLKTQSLNKNTVTTVKEPWSW